MFFIFYIGEGSQPGSGPAGLKCASCTRCHVFHWVHLFEVGDFKGSFEINNSHQGPA